MRFDSCGTDGIIQVEKLPEDRIEATYRVRIALDVLSTEEGCRDWVSFLQFLAKIHTLTV